MKSICWVFAFLHALELSHGQRADGQYWPCNPVVNASCPPNPALPQSSYAMDFTAQSTLPSDWSMSSGGTPVTFDKSGAEFTFKSRYDAPQIYTNFYILFGRVEVVMQAAPGQGIISSSVLLSDDFDEIDWEWSGNNFGAAGTNGQVQNNYFGKGVTGNYDRGAFINVTNPQATFHTYAVEWSPTSLVWSIDGTAVRTLLAADCTTQDHQYPQSPSKIQLGLWDGGDAGENPGTVAWAGGYTNVSLAPFTMRVKSVSITNQNPAYAYNWTNQNGTYQSIQLIQNPSWNATSASTSGSGLMPPSANPGTSSSAAHQISPKGPSGNAVSTTPTGAPSPAPSAATTPTASVATASPESSMGITSSANSGYVSSTGVPLSSTASPATSNSPSTPSSSGNGNTFPSSTASTSSPSAPAPASPSSASASTSPSSVPASTSSSTAPASTSPSSAPASTSSASAPAFPSPESVSSCPIGATLGSQTTPQPEAAVSSGAASSSSLCPGSHGQTRSMAMGNYGIRCGMDIPGADIATLPGGDLQSCMGLCDQHSAAGTSSGGSRCDGVAYRPDESQCYLKSFSKGALKPSAAQYSADCALRVPGGFSKHFRRFHGVFF